MHKILFLAIASTLLFIPAHAQELSHTWGILTQSEKELKTYDLDPEAEAIILFDIGNAHFAETNYGLQIHFERIKRMKILKNGGLKYADIEIPYYTNGSGKTEKVLDIKAIAYNEETGQWVKSELDKKSIFDNKKSKNWREKKFAIPHVKKGTIIEYTYTLETPFMYNLPKWYFQDRIPTLFSNYTVRMVPFYQYTAIAQGLVQGDIIKKEESISERSYAEVKFKELIYSFGKKDVPAFKDESYITSINDYVMKLDFQLSQIHYPKGGSEEILTTWPKLVADLNERENFGEYIHKSNKFVKEILANEVDLSGMTALKKVEKLINYVKSTYRWDGNTGHVARKSPKEFVKQQTGNVSDINLFLIALLRGAGIKATPIIASTRDHGKVKTGYPFEHYFNYTLILVETGNKSFLTDGTATRLNYNLIPTRCINHLGLLVDEKEGEWINLVSKG